MTDRDLRPESPSIEAARTIFRKQLMRPDEEERVSSSSNLTINHSHGEVTSHSQSGNDFLKALFPRISSSLASKMEISICHAQSSKCGSKRFNGQNFLIVIYMEEIFFLEAQSFVFFDGRAPKLPTNANSLQNQVDEID